VTATPGADGPPQVRQLDAERFEVVDGLGRTTPVVLRRDARVGLGLMAVAPSTIVAEAIAMLVEQGRWPPGPEGEAARVAPPSASDPGASDVVGMLAALPGALDDLRARVSG